MTLSRGNQCSQKGNNKEIIKGEEIKEKITRLCQDQETETSTNIKDCLKELK